MNTYFLARYLLPLGAVFGLVAAAQAQEAERPLSYSLSQTFTRDSNIFRLGDSTLLAPQLLNSPLIAPLSAQRADTISRTSLGASYGNTMGTQTFSLNAGLDFSRYSRNSRLDSTGYSLMGNWYGDLDRAWYAAVNASIQSSRTDFNNQNGLALNIANTSNLGGKIGYRFSPTWSVFSGLGATRTRNSADSVSTANTSQAMVDAGVKYDPGTGLSAELFVQHRAVSYPNRESVDLIGNLIASLVDNSYNTNQLVGRINYQVTGQSRLSADVGVSDVRFKAYPLRDTTGLVLGLNYRYTYSDALELGARINRDLGGDQSSFASPVQSNRFALDASWRATGRISVLSNYSFNSRKFSADTGAILGTNQLTSDQLRTAGITARYELFRTVNLSAGWLLSSRSADAAGLAYRGNTISLGVDVKLD